MRAYVGASMNGKCFAKQVVAHLICMRVIITSRWHDAEVSIDLADDRIAYARYWSEMDTQDLLAADTCVFVNLSPSSSGGMWVEFGLALAMGKRIILIGPRASVFTWQCQNYECVEEFMHSVEYMKPLSLSRRLLQSLLRYLFLMVK